MKPLDKTPPIRLQVFLSHSGLCSRREAMKIIQQGRVSLNGQITTEPSTPVDPVKDNVAVDGQDIKSSAHEYILLNKPKGYVTTTADPHAQKTVLDLVPKEFQHLYPAGRLDQDTQGLLLLTNDGDVAYKLTHPKFNVDKTYLAKISGVLAPLEKEKLEKGVVIEDKITAPSKITNVRISLGQTEFLITIHEGRKRQIRLMLQAVGHKVVDLTRIKQGPLSLGDLKLGCWRRLSEQEILQLKSI
ncbi:MAG: pseudouridine synthase [Candidatus Omnitrophota bacterium]